MDFFPDFAPNSRKGWRLLLFQSNLRKQIRQLPKILKFVRIIHYYSKLFTGVLTRHGGCCPCVPTRTSTPSTGSGRTTSRRRCSASTTSTTPTAPFRRRPSLPGVDTREAVLSFVWIVLSSLPVTSAEIVTQFTLVDVAYLFFRGAQAASVFLLCLHFNEAFDLMDPSCAMLGL